MSGFSRYALIEKLKRSVTSKGTRTKEMNTIAWCTFSSTAYNVLMIRGIYDHILFIN